MDTNLNLEITPITLDSLIENYSKRLLNRAYYLLSNKEDAEDVVQEVFLAVYNKRESLANVVSVEAWLMRILYNKIADLYKERYKKPIENIDFEHDFDQNGEWKRTDITNEWDEHPESMESLLNNQDFRKLFYGCIDKLPPKWKVVVKLCYLNNKKGNEICTELNISTTSYWKLLQRSRLQLRECIDINWFNQ